MSRLFRFLVLGLSLLFCYNANSQVTLKLTDREVTEGDQVEVILTVADFGQITKIDLSLNWDTSYLEFNSIDPENIGALDLNNFKRGEVDNGGIGMEWDAVGLPFVSIPDGDPLFKLFFTAKKAIESTKIELSDFPTTVAIVRTTNSNNPFDLRDLTEDDDFSGGNITILPSTSGMISPPPPTTSSTAAEDLIFSITPDKDIACIDERICYSIEVENFDSILSFQFPLDWDPAVLEYDTSENINLANLAEPATTPEGSLRITYEGDIGDPIHLINGTSVLDGTSIVDLCFNVIGANNNQQSIFFGPDSKDQLGTDAVNKDEIEVNVDFMSFPNETFDCSKTVILNTACNSGVPGEQVCVDIQPVIFQNVGDLFFSLNWDQTALDFVTLRDPNPALVGLAGNIDPATGNLNIEWNAAIGVTEGVTLTQDDLPIATVCFDINANASSGSFIEVSYSDEFLSDIDGTAFETNRLEDCAIEVMEPPLPEPILSAASDIRVTEGEEICVEVLVENFTGITAFEFPVLWDKDVLEFKRIEGEAFLGIDVNTATASDGNIVIDWGSAMPQSLQGKAVLLSICFTAIGEPSSAIAFTANNGADRSFSIETVPLVSTIETGFVTIVAGADNPVTFSTMPMDNLARNKPVCVPVTVKDFNNIFAATILVKWDSMVLRFDSISNVQLPDFQANTLNTNIRGQFALSWFDNADFQPVSLNDGDVIFDLCFTTIGDIGACTEIEFPSSIPGLLGGDNNNQVAEILNELTVGEHIGVVDEGSEMCITTFGIESFNLQDPTCDSLGNVNAIIVGGQDGYIFNWYFNETLQTQGSSTGLSQNLPLSNQLDSVCLVVYAGGDIDITDRKCEPVMINDTRKPIALAGDDIDIGCVDNPDLFPTQLLGEIERNSDPESFLYESEWTTINGSIEPAFSDTSDVIAIGLGTYILTITTNSGCSASDTLEIVSSAAPSLTIDPDNDEITCNTSQVTLSASSSVTGEEWEYNWTNSDGDTLTGIDPFELVIEQGGRYTFSVNNPSSGCNASEPVIINENIPVVNAEAGPFIIELLCEDEFKELDVRDLNEDAGNLSIQWTSEQPIQDAETLNPTVTEVGIYVLKITDNPTGCFGTDTIRVRADPELPVAKARDEAYIGCDQTQTVLRPIYNGLDGTSVGAKFKHTWTTTNGMPISGEEEDTAVARILGEYLFIVINTENRACAADTARVQVVEDKTLPEFEIPSGQTISCSADCVELQVETNDIDSDFTYEWTTDVGNLCSGVNSLNVQVDEVGTYFLEVTNTANNCSTKKGINVFPDPENGVFPDAGAATKELTCRQDTVLLNGSASTSSTGNAILYEWRFEDEEEVLTREAVLMATIPGRYRLTVIDEAAECQGSGSVEVTENKDFPEADAGSDFPLEGCTVAAFQLNALNSASGDDITYQWTSSDGEIISDETTLTPTVNQPGTYTLVVTNETSGCTDTDEAVVSTTVFSPAAIVEETERTLDCNDNTIILDAESSITDDGTNSATIEWTTEDGNIISGANTKSLVVDSAGTYILILTADNGCEDKATVVVTSTARLPEIDAGEGFRITCNEQMTIDASNSSSYENLVIEWTTNDGSFVSGENTLMPEINLGGTYTLVITDTTNNCRVEDMIVIASDGILPVAQAGDNIEVCGRDAVLSASPVTDGITGVWTTLNGGQVDANDPLTNVTNLSAGENQFIWTLSSEECPDFSNDTVTINALTLPVAVADDFEYIVGEGTVELDLVGNDQPNTDNFAINIIREPTSSILNKVSEGVYSLDLPSRPTRQDFQYEICSAICSDVCADAVVRLVVRPEALDSIDINPNAITPNGDGLNDLLIFDELYIEDYPQSELVIFNRWGDIVHKISPYNNDWQGEGSDGTPIPEGTYYYILRLDISEGEIIRGDVTIMR